MNVAILGLGRSGLAIGRAALAKGWAAHVYDETSEERLSKRDVLDDARAIGLHVTLGWSGGFEGTVDILVLNPAIPPKHPKVLSALAAGIEVIGEIEFAYRISKAPIVAITGSNGKSTTTVMTWLALRECGVEAKLCGNIYGSGFPEEPLTDAAATSTPDQILVAEVSSFQLEWVSQFRPVAATITNIVPEHADRVAWDDYVASKHRIFAAQGKGDFAVVRANDPVVVPPGGVANAYRPRGSRDPLPARTDVTVLTFGATGEQGRVEENDLLIYGRKYPKSRFKFTEPYNMVNAACAALLACGAMAARLGLPQPPDAVIDQIMAGIARFEFIAHRMEPVGMKNGIRVINNSMCTNPDAVVASAQAVRDPVHILMGGVNKGLDFRRLKNYLANGRNRAYLFGRDAEELSKMLGENLPIFDTMKEAFVAATEVAVKGEVIMLAPGCASSDQFRDFRDRGDVFKEIAKDWLES